MALGFASGFGQGAQIEQNRQVIDQNRQQLEQDNQQKQAAAQQQMVEKVTTNIEASVVQTETAIKELVANGIDPNSPEGQQMIMPLVKGLQGVAQQAAQIGIPVDMNTIGARLKIASTAPTPEELLTRKTDETRATSQASAEGTAKGTPVTPELRSVGNQIIQISTGEDGSIETIPIFTGQDKDPKPETFLNPKTGSYFTVDTSNAEEVKKAQEISAYKSTAPSGGTVEPSSSQRLAASFATRLENSSNIITEVGDQFTGFTSRGAGLLPQGLKSEDRQKFEQAQRDFVNAALRRESGAAIAPSEFESAELQYMPKPGDSKEVLTQKTQNRTVIAQALKLEAGSAYDELKGSLPQMVTIKGMPMAVGSVVTNSKGQKGRVEQDGSITVLQ